MTQIIIFTDLDGTLLDETYSYQKALPALELVRKKRIPMVFCTSKTLPETEYYRHRLESRDPFIVESGGAIFIPKGYFDFKFSFDRKTEDYFIIELGTPYERLRRALKSLARDGITVLGFGDMSDAELSRDSGLSFSKARLAKQRDYSEPFKIVKGKEDEIRRMIESKGLNFKHGGRYYDIMGDNDKGKAVRILKELFRRKFKKIKSIGFGNSENDLPMLESVDKGHMIKSPKEWNRIVKGLLK